MPDDRMPLHTADALVLRTYKLGETDRIVVFLTADRGKRRGVARGARRPRSPYAGALEPLTLGRIAYFEREQRDLVRLRYVEPICSPLSAPSAEGLAHVGYFAELIDEWAPEADPNERLFRLGAAVIQALAAGVSVEPLARYFEYWLLRLQGVYPSESGLKLSPAALAFLQSARELPPARLGEASLPAAAERELATAHQALITRHLEKHLKSLKVLHAVAGG